MEQHFKQYNGYRVCLNSISEETCTTVFLNSSFEIIYIFFEDYAPNLIQTYGLGIINMICDPGLRSQIIPAFDSHQKIKNPRGSKTIKKTGKINLFLTPIITNSIRRNPIIYNLLSELYGKQKLAFVNGLDSIIYKTKGSEDYPSTIDCKLFKPLEGIDGLDNPFHYCCFVCISLYQPTENKGEEYGQISLLENFDFHYELIRQLIAPEGKYPVEKQKKGVDFNLLENLNVDSINNEITTQFKGCKGNLKLLKWKTVDLKAGDVLIFDCRLPYKIAKNFTDIPAVYIPVSLRPISSKWYKSQKHSNLLNSIKNGKVGNWDKRTFKDCNLDEYRWRTSKECPEFAKLENCIDMKDFKSFDKVIFGLDESILVEN
jgi:hypothetical protein